MEQMSPPSRQFTVLDYTILVEVKEIYDPYILSNGILFRVEVNFAKHDPYWTKEELSTMKHNGWKPGSVATQVYLTSDETRLESVIFDVVFYWSEFHRIIEESKERQKQFSIAEMFEKIHNRLCPQKEN